MEADLIRSTKKLFGLTKLLFCLEKSTFGLKNNSFGLTKRSNGTTSDLYHRNSKVMVQQINQPVIKTDRSV